MCFCFESAGALVFIARLVSFSSVLQVFRDRVRGRSPLFPPSTCLRGPRDKARGKEPHCQIGQEVPADRLVSLWHPRCLFGAALSETPGDRARGQFGQGSPGQRQFGQSPGQSQFGQEVPA